MKLYHEYDKIEVGIDEVGRGCLFGRVYSAAVILPKEIDEEDEFYLEIKDSKKHTAKNRELLDEYIKHIALDYQISYQEPKVIDKINILQATYRTMHENIDKLHIDVDKILVDGNNFKPYYKWTDDGAEQIEHKCVVDGDNVYTSIAAASILAKVARDKYIEELCEKNPELDENYNILSNKGYGAKAHIDGIKQYGIVEGHRKTFGICSTYVN